MENHDFSQVIPNLHKLKPETIELFIKDNPWFQEVYNSNDIDFIMNRMIDEINSRRDKYEFALESEHEYLVFEVFWDALAATDILGIDYDNYEFCFYEDLDDEE